MKGTCASGVKIRLPHTHSDLIEASKWVPNWIDKMDYVSLDLYKCREMVRIKYQNFLNVFSKANTEVLLLHTENGNEIYPSPAPVLPLVVSIDFCRSPKEQSLL